MAAYDLKKLREAADSACDEAFIDHVEGAINWGDLYCVSAEHYVTDDGDEGYRVHIEEASPDCGEFHRYVRAKLSLAGFDNVEVITEW